MEIGRCRAQIVIKSSTALYLYPIMRLKINKINFPPIEGEFDKTISRKKRKRQNWMERYESRRVMLRIKNWNVCFVQQQCSNWTSQSDVCGVRRGNGWVLEYRTIRFIAIVVAFAVVVVVVSHRKAFDCSALYYTTRQSLRMNVLDWKTDIRKAFFPLVYECVYVSLCMNQKNYLLSKANVS